MRIKFAQKPLSLGGEMVELSPDEFLQHFDTSWSEELVSSSATEKEKYPYLDALVICQLDNKRYGLCTSKEIPAGSEICFDDSSYEDDTIKQEKRRYADFIVHAPNVKHYDKIDEAAVLTPNVVRKQTGQKATIEALQTIPAGSLLAREYGAHNFCKVPAQWLYKDGSLVDSQCYRLRYGPINYDKKIYLLKRTTHVRALFLNVTDPYASNSFDKEMYSRYRLRHKLARIHMIPAVYDYLPQHEPHLAVVKRMCQINAEKISLHSYWHKLPGLKCDLHVMSELPESPAKYKDSYLFIKKNDTQELYYIDSNGKNKKVKINDLKLFEEKINQIRLENATTLYLSQDQIEEIITANGGHTRLEKVVHGTKVDVVCRTRNKEDYQCALGFFNHPKLKQIQHEEINEFVLSGIDEKEIANLPNLFK